MTELEDDISADLEDDNPGEDDDPAENDLDDEPSLGASTTTTARSAGPRVAGAIWSMTTPKAALATMTGCWSKSGTKTVSIR
jgi:hypothetical protein